MRLHRAVEREGHRHGWVIDRVSGCDVLGQVLWAIKIRHDWEARAALRTHPDELVAIWWTEARDLDAVEAVAVADAIITDSKYSSI